MCRFFFIACIVFWATAAHAIVNVEEMRVQAAQEGFSGNLSFDVNGESGNTDKASAAFGSRAQWKQDAITNFMILNHTYGETDGERDTNKAFFHARHVRQFNPRWAGEGFGQLEQNEFTRLSYRQLLGGGARITLAEEENKKGIFLGLGAFYSREKLDPREGTTDEGTESFWRANVYFVFKYALNSQVRVLNMTYYQPAFENFNDYRFLEQVALKVKMAERLDLKLSLEIVHDSRPPQLVEKTDTVYSTGIEYSF